MSFEKAIRFVLIHEGGYVDDPDDPGGETNFGISKRAHPREDIKNMTKERAAAIYRSDYWDRCHCDALPPSLAMVTFDAAVNQGVGAAVRMLQKAVGTTVDGVMGPMTEAAAQAMGSGDTALLKMAAERGYRYGQTKNFDKYGRGWMRRLFAVTALALEDL